MVYLFPGPRSYIWYTFHISSVNCSKEHHHKHTSVISLCRKPSINFRTRSWWRSSPICPTDSCAASPASARNGARLPTTAACGCACPSGRNTPTSWSTTSTRWLVWSGHVSAPPYATLRCRANSALPQCFTNWPTSVPTWSISPWISPTPCSCTISTTWTPFRATCAVWPSVCRRSSSWKASWGKFIRVCLLWRCFIS